VQPRPAKEEQFTEPDMAYHNSFHQRAVHVDQKPLADDEPPPRLPSGYFHTYRTKRPLQLLYLDGQAAAKSSFGTQDTQDRVLLAGIDLGHGMIQREYNRAHALCNLSANAWESKIDGFVRMEGGFEVILCSFLDNLDVVSIIKPKSSAYGSRFWYYYDLAIGADFDGTAQGKVRLDFGRFVSAFAYEDLVGDDEVGRSRINNESAQLGVMRKDVRDMVMREETSPGSEPEWQLITDTIISRYAKRIEITASGLLTDAETLRQDLYSAMQPFIDLENRNTTEELGRCTAQLLPRASQRGDSVPARAVTEVLNMICSTFLQASKETSYEVAVSLVRDLRKELDWQIWKRCSECSDFEVCMLPAW
jgi:hypothetical protein